MNGRVSKRLRAEASDLAMARKGRYVRGSDGSIRLKPGTAGATCQRLKREHNRARRQTI